MRRGGRRVVTNHWSNAARAARSMTLSTVSSAGADRRKKARPNSCSKREVHMRTEEERDRLRETSLVFVVSTLGVLLFVAFAARLSAQEPATLPVTPLTAYTSPWGQGAKIKALIIGRRGDDMIVRAQDGRADIVPLTAETKISSPSGLFKMDKKH